ncbi:MAG: DEAD/DEAH box helicase [Thaumarchaeota archaeon]|nr:DEAD/DEAH box helicase [Nitrososphaerota archaeon]
MSIKLVFNDIEIDKELISSLRKEGIEEPTEIQEKAIPLLLDGEDVIGQANTGTGKTLAFGIPIVQMIKNETRDIEALVLVPTRELSAQVSKEIKKISRYKSLRMTKVCGGESPNIQKASIRRNPSLVVATPGRLIDFIERGVVNLDWVKFLVIDEADTMLEMGFIEDIEFIIRSIENKHQTALFSATFPQPIVQLAKKYQTQAKRIMIHEDNKISEEKLEQYYLCVNSERNKQDLLIELIEDIKPEKGIIFCRTKSDSNRIHKVLRGLEIKAVVINGDMSQSQRDRSMRNFKDKRTRIIVATDLLSRGIHVENVDYIINYNVPKNRDSYFHRIGRTARIGTEVIGKAITIVAGRETRDFVELKREIKTNITSFKGKQIYRYEIPLDEESFAKSGRRNGRGGSPRYGRGSPNRSSSGGRRYGGNRSGGYGGRSGGYGNRSGGDNNRSGGYGNRSGGDNNRSGGDNNRSGGDNNRSGGDNNRSGGDNNRSGGYGGRSGGYGNRSGGSSKNREGSENRSGYFSGEDRNNSEKSRKGNKDNKKSQYKKRSRKTTY